MVALSPAFSPAVLKGIQLDPKNPFRFHFLMDTGNDPLSKQEASKLIKYFLASLTIPEKDLWVNLSPYEKNRIVPQEFGQTEMGRDLLAEDYILKQITASLIYPEDKIGKEFWQKVYAQARAKYGTTNIPINTFNKVWIVPDKAVVYENNDTAFVLQNHLKVMLEEDYLSMQKHKSFHTDYLDSQIIREIVIPQLEHEVNYGKSFSQLRQVFYSLILATWYKKKIKDSIINEVYSNQSKITSLSYPNAKDMSSPNALVGDPQYIYQQYLKAFKKGVFNYIKEEPDPLTNETMPRKYFSGGVNAQQISVNMAMVGPGQVSIRDFASIGQITEIDGDLGLTQPSDQAMESQEQNRSGYGFIGTKVPSSEINFYENLLRDHGFTFQQRRLLANTLTRIREGELLLRTKFFRQGDIKNILDHRSFDIGHFAVQIKKEEQLYLGATTKEKQIMFNDQNINKLLFKRLIPYDWLESFVAEDLSGNQATIFLLYLHNPKEVLQNIKPVINKLVAGEIYSRHDATCRVLLWRNPEAKYKAIKKTAPKIQETLDWPEKKTIRWLIENSLQFTVERLRQNGKKEREIYALLSPMILYEKDYGKDMAMSNDKEAKDPGHDNFAKGSTAVFQRLFMVDPRAYGVFYEINANMDKDNPADGLKAYGQWKNYFSALQHAGIPINILRQIHGVPDEVFAANAGLTVLGKDGKKYFIPSRFATKQRKPEEALFINYFRSLGYIIADVVKGYDWEGEGDMLFFNGWLLAGFNHYDKTFKKKDWKRSDPEGHKQVARALGLEDKLVLLELKDPLGKLYHLDTALFPLDDETIMYFPGAFSEQDRRRIESIAKHVIRLSEKDARNFAANAITIPGTKKVILNAGISGQLKKQIEARGYTVIEVPMSEFLKAGGSTKCCILKMFAYIDPELDLSPYSIGSTAQDQAMMTENTLNAPITDPNEIFSYLSFKDFIFDPETLDAIEAQGNLNDVERHILSVVKHFDMFSVHGNLIYDLVTKKGILITGPSGVGKSNVTSRLINNPRFSLRADDSVIAFFDKNGDLQASLSALPLREPNRRNQQGQDEPYAQKTDLKLGFVPVSTFIHLWPKDSIQTFQINSGKLKNTFIGIIRDKADRLLQSKKIFGVNVLVPGIPYRDYDHLTAEIMKILPADAEMKVNEKGGIDLNPAQMNMQVTRQGRDFKFDFNGITIDAAQVTGAVFTIRQMTPVINLPQILGLRMAFTGQAAQNRSS